MNIEERLQSARPAMPSAELDRRIETLFGDGVRGRASAFRPSCRGLLLALGSLCAAAAIAAALSLRTPRADLVRAAPVNSRRIGATGMFQQMLLTPPARRRPMPYMEVTVASPQKTLATGESP